MTLPQAHSFPCSNCGARLEYDATCRAMKCPYCRSEQAIDIGSSHGVREIPIEEGYRLALRGLGAPVTAIGCSECGATINVGEVERTAQCAFCGSHKVLPRAADPNLIRPESLVPFLVDQAAASQRFASWIRGLWFRPNDLKKLARVEQMGGVYIPFWTFDTLAQSRWTADAGYYYYETEHYTVVVNGRTETRTRQIRHTRWVPASGNRTDHYDDELVCASRGLPGDLVRRISSFDTKTLIPYSPQFLAGWRAESYAIDLSDAWMQAEAAILATQEGRCADDIPGDTFRFLNVDSRLSRTTFKHVLLPIWIAAYRYRGKVYRFLVNGQTGEIAGKAPWSVWKIVSFVAFLVLAIALLAMAMMDDPAIEPTYSYEEPRDLAPLPTYTPQPMPIQPAQPSPLRAR